MTLPVPTEEAEQANFVRWLEMRGYMFTHVPHSTFTKSWKVKNRNTRLGVRAGFPDLIIIANGELIIIEMKRVSGGALSPKQKEWIAALQTTGIAVAVCKGADEAIQFVKSVVEL